MPTGPPAPPTPEQLRREKAARNYRRARRKAREAAGEIKELNIIAMMDMMTIILVFLLKSYQASTINVNMGEDLTDPRSRRRSSSRRRTSPSRSRCSEAGGERPRVVEMQGGVDPARSRRRAGKADGFYVGAVYDALKKEVDKQKYIAQYNKAAPFTGRVNVVADKKIAVPDAHGGPVHRRPGGARRVQVHGDEERS